MFFNIYCTCQPITEVHNTHQHNFQVNFALLSKLSCTKRWKEGCCLRKENHILFLISGVSQIKITSWSWEKIFFYLHSLICYIELCTPLGGGLARLGVIISKFFFRWSSVSFFTCFRNMTYMYLIAQIPQIWAPEHNIFSEIIIFFKRVPVVLWGYNNNCKD